MGDAEEDDDGELHIGSTATNTVGSLMQSVVGMSVLVADDDVGDDDNREEAVEIDSSKERAIGRARIPHNLQRWLCFEFLTPGFTFSLAPPPSAFLLEPKIVSVQTVMHLKCKGTRSYECNY